MLVHFAGSSSFCQPIPIKAIPGSCFHCSYSLSSWLTLCQSSQRTETKNSRAQGNKLLEQMVSKKKIGKKQNKTNARGDWQMLGNTSQLCFGGISTKTVCFVSSGRVVLFHRPADAHCCNTAKCIRNAKSRRQLGGQGFILSCPPICSS